MRSSIETLAESDPTPLNSPPILKPQCFPDHEPNQICLTKNTVGYISPTRLMTVGVVAPKNTQTRFPSLISAGPNLIILALAGLVKTTICAGRNDSNRIGVDACMI